MTDEMLEVTDLWETAAQIHTVEQFKAWVQTEVRNVMPHGALACGHGRVSAAGVSMDYVLTVDYPIEHLAAIRNSAGCIDTPLMRRWLEKRLPLLFDVEHPWPEMSPSWLASFRQYRLVNAAVHANYDEARCIGTYFSFHRLPEPLGQAHRAILAGITPLLHETLIRVISRLDAGHSVWDTLSVREREIADYVGHGLSNLDIAHALAISENTVKHHVVNILKKTGSPNRPRLMALMANQQKVNSTTVL